MSDHDAGLVIVCDGVLGESANLGNTKRLVGEEFNPDRTAVGRGIRVGICSWRSILAQHGVAGAGRELKLAAAEKMTTLLETKKLHIHFQIVVVGRSNAYFTEPSGLQYSSRNLSREMLISSSASSYSCKRPLSEQSISHALELSPG